MMVGSLGVLNALLMSNILNLLGRHPIISQEASVVSTL